MGFSGSFHVETAEEFYCQCLPRVHCEVVVLEDTCGNLIQVYQV